MEINLYFTMHDILKHSFHFEQLAKIAGRIVVDNYNKQIFEIIGKIQQMMQSHKHQSLADGEMKDLCTIAIDIGQQKYSLPVKVTMDSQASFRAAIELTVSQPYIVINLYEFRFDDSYSPQLSHKLKPLLVHEITHFVDWVHDPINSKVVEKDSPDFEFYQEFQELFLQHQSKQPNPLDYSDINSFRGKQIEDIATKNVLKFVKTKQFKSLLTKYNKKLDSDVLGSLLKLIQGVYLSDVNLYRDTGGFFFDAPRTPTEKAEFKQISDVGHTLYYRSKSEMKAFINQIISEVWSYMTYDDHSKTAIELIRGKTTVTAVIDGLLTESEAFEQIKPYMTQENLEQIYKAVANYLTKSYTRKGVKDWETMAGVSLSPDEEFSYRYLLDLYFRKPSLLTEKMKDQSFIDKYKKPLAILKARLDYERAASKAIKAMPKLND